MAQADEVDNKYLQVQLLLALFKEGKTLNSSRKTLMTLWPSKLIVFDCMALI